MFKNTTSLGAEFKAVKQLSLISFANE